MLSQFFMSRDVSGKDTALTRLNRQIEELTSLLALERAGKADAQSSLAALQATLDAADKEKATPAGQIAGQRRGGRGRGRDGRRGRPQARRPEARSSSRALAQVDILNQQISALRRQLAAIEDALNASESRDKEAQAKIADLGSRLNVALAQKVQELNALPLGLLRPPARDPRQPARHPRRRRPVRVRIRGAVRHRPGRGQARRRRRARQAGRPPSSISNARSRPRSPGCCASTATPTSGRSSRRSSSRTGTCRPQRAIAVVQYLVVQGRRPAAARRGRLRRVPADRSRRQARRR